MRHLLYLSAIVLFFLAACKKHSSAGNSGTNVNPPPPPGNVDTTLQFPRVATIYSKHAENQDSGKKAIARYNLYVSDMTWWGLGCGGDANCQGHSGMTTGQYLKFLNPAQLDLMYVHSVFYEGWSAPADGRGYIIGTTPYYFDLRWLLTYAGSTLSGGVDNIASGIPVNDCSKFAVGDYVLLGGVGTQAVELVQVTARSTSSGAGSLTVNRAQLSQNGKFPAVSHNSGDYARSVAYAWSQGFMAFNMSSGCPGSDINPGLGSNETYNQFMGAFWADKIAHDPLYANLDGLFLDNFVDVPSQLITNASRVDYMNQNTATPSPDNANAWKAGMADLAHQVRLSMPGKIVIANTGGNVTNTGASLNGGMIEGVDQNGKNSFVGDANGDPTAFYDSWISGGAAPQVFVYNGSDAISTGVDAARTDYRTMRFLLTLTMLNNGYFDYDEFLVSNPSAGLNSGGHQTTWWYDEYDNAGQGTGYLGYALAAATQPVTGVFRRDFEKGICLCNTTTIAQTIPLGKKYKKINGVQDHATNDGSGVTAVTLPPGDGIILLSIF